MKIHIIKTKATKRQIEEMLFALNSYIKVAVDIKKEILTGGGMLHADCKAVLLENGSKQKDIWGADWLPGSKKVRFESLINIRPKRNNPSMAVQDRQICGKIERIIVHKLNI